MSKIDSELRAAFGRSLQALEGDLTRARELGKAREVMAFRTALASIAKKAAASSATPAPAASATAGKAPSAPLESASIPGQWTSLFNGRNLDGWTASGNSRAFSLDDYAIKASGNPGMLYYDGPLAHGARFRDFDFRAEVKTDGGAKSGVFFHTANEGSGVPVRGYEVEIYNGTGDSGKTGGLGEVDPLEQSPVADGKWFKLEISVRGMDILVKIDGKEVVRRTQFKEFNPPSAYPGRLLREGTFALQCEFSPNGATWFRKIEVRPYTDPLTASCRIKQGTRIERSPPDLRTLPKGRIYAWGIGREDQPIDISQYDRGNDFVRVYVKGDGRWYALRARGSMVTTDGYQRNLDDVAQFVPRGDGAGPVVIWKDGRARSEGRNPVLAFGIEQGNLVRGAAGSSYYAVLDAQGRVGGNVGDKWDKGMRLPPQGPTDIMDISFAYRTCWCLRANGQLVWFGKPSEGQLPPERNRDIVAVEGSPDADHVLALNRKGEVFAWGRKNDFGCLDVPQAARSGMRAIRVSPRGGISAARGKDGKWIAWGNDKDGVVAKINSLGKDVVDLAFNDRLLFWIE